MSEDRMTKEEFLANRKAAGRVIDVETCDIAEWWVPTMDPYGVEPDLPDEMRQIGRLTFVQSAESDGPVCQYDCRRTSAARCAPVSNAEWSKRSFLGNKKSRYLTAGTHGTWQGGQIEEVCHEPTDSPEQRGATSRKPRLAAPWSLPRSPPCGFPIRPRSLGLSRSAMPQACQDPLPLESDQISQRSEMTRCAEPDLMVSARRPLVAPSEHPSTCRFGVEYPPRRCSFD